MTYENTQILISVIFGICGFIMAYYLRRGLGFVLLTLLLFAAFKGLESLKYAPDWDSFDKFVTILQQLGRTMLTLINNMITTAGTLSIMLFLFGGILGLIFSRKGAP